MTNWESRRERGTRPQRATDGGFTLVEVVISISLLALVIIPILDATFTSVKASATASRVSELETVLANAADRVNRAPTLCDYALYVQAAAVANGWNASQATASYQYYTAGASAADDGTWSTPGTGVTAACGPSGTRSPRLIQLVTISVTTDAGSITRQIQVVKSDV